MESTAGTKIKNGPEGLTVARAVPSLRGRYFPLT